ncbi:MAG: hypothetical protein ACC628_11575, partial [Pirellulaceae bacterium]
MNGASFGPIELVIMLGVLGLSVVMVFLLVWSLVWVYRDANLRGKPGWLVALLCFLFNWPISLVLWLVFRPDLPGTAVGK